MKKKHNYYGLVAVVFLLCSSKLGAVLAVGGPCTYTDIPGKAVIRSIENSNPSEMRADEFPDVQVRFDFIPNDKTPKGDQRFLKTYPNESRSYVHHGRSDISQEWVRDKNIEVGKEFTAVRKQIQTGTCTPVVFTFPDLEDK